MIVVLDSCTKELFATTTQFKLEKWLPVICNELFAMLIPTPQIVGPVIAKSEMFTLSTSPERKINTKIAKLRGYIPAILNSSMSSSGQMYSTTPPCKVMLRFI